jgi:hypothetical protein
MSEDLYKFPSTPHLAWLGDEPVRDDKVLSPAEAELFLRVPVVVEEKVDGANLGLSFDASGQIRFQNRGHWLRGPLSGQWERLRGWAAAHEQALCDVLPAQHILFGEWCYAKHSIPYDHLPDWFLAFDVLDSCTGRFWSTPRRNALAGTADIATVPEIARGAFRMPDLHTMLEGRSAVGDVPREGLYLRHEDADWLLARAKLVRAAFTQSIGEHWSRHGCTPNRVQPAVTLVAR